MRELLQDDQVREALSTYVVDELYTNGDVSGRLQESLPPDLAGIAAPLAGALRAPAVTAVDRLLERPRVQALWEKVNRVAHRAADRDPGRQPAPERLDGRTARSSSTCARSSSTSAPSSASATSWTSACRQDVGQVTVLESGQLATAQDAVKVIKALSWLLFLITLVCWGVALWLARGWRRVALRGIGVSLLDRRPPAARDPAGGRQLRRQCADQRRRRRSATPRTPAG